MIKKYLLERSSWILLFIFYQVFLLFIAYIDPTIPVESVLYIILLSMTLLILFLIVRYHKESTFYKRLAEWDTTQDLATTATPDSPFEKVIVESIILQTELYKTRTSENRTFLEQEKDELLSWIHEVKTPLTTMRLMIDRLEDKPLQTQLMNEWLRIHLLLDVQLHQKRMPFIHNDLYIEEIELEPLIIKEIKEILSWCIYKGIGFDVSLQVPVVLTDAKWLGFILRQIITNAVKYSENNDILIQSDIKNDQTILTIQDFGQGIDSKDLPRIFDKGFTSTKGHRDQKATGMGLYLAKKAAQSLMIQIDVESELHVGTTFLLTFPKKNAFVQIKSM